MILLVVIVIVVVGGVAIWAWFTDDEKRAERLGWLRENEDPESYTGSDFQQGFDR